MARCEEGYRCEICGKDVESIADSDLYLRYVIGELPPEVLHTTPERHIRCNPTLAQFITDPRFRPPVVVEGAFAKGLLDPSFAREREQLVTGGYRRLLELADQGGDADVTAYPLPEAREKYRR